MKNGAVSGFVNFMILMPRLSPLIGCKECSSSYTGMMPEPFKASDSRSRSTMEFELDGRKATKFFSFAEKLEQSTNREWKKDKGNLV